MKLRYLVLVGMIALAACANSSVPPAQTLGEACNTYANALDQLTPLRAAGKLDAATVQAVDTANALTSPLCSPGTVPSNTAAAIAFVVDEAQAIYAIVQKGKNS